MSYWLWTFLLARKQIDVLDDDDDRHKKVIITLDDHSKRTINM